MATDIRNLPANVSATVDFRTWGLGISAQFAAMGLVKTADTGQIDWSTVVTPSSGSYAGYEIWRFNDALQATKPVYFKFEYGMDTNSPRFRVTPGTGSNGAGTITGQLSAQTFTGAASSAGTGNLPSYCSGNSGRLNLVTNLEAATNVRSWCVFIERTKNGAGVDTGDGFIAFIGGGNGNAKYQFFPFFGVVPAPSLTNALALDLNIGGLTSFGGDVALAPTCAFWGKMFYASWCSYKTTEIATLVPITLTHLGAARTYMPMGAGIQSTANNINAGSGYSNAILWE